MSIYHFSGSSPVSGITFRYANDRPPVGLVSARDGIPAEQLSTIRRALDAQGWHAVPVTVEGKDVLQVSGFEGEGQLAAFLHASHFTYGNPGITAEPGDHPKRSWQEWIESGALRGAGVLNLIGDLALLGSGIKSGSTWETAGGALYTAGAGVLARYGNVKTEHHVRQVLENTAEFLKQQGSQMPEDCGLYTILKERRNGVVHNTENFLYRYPAQVMLGTYTLGALAMLQAGMKKGNPWGIAYGVSSVGVKAASLLIPEKKNAEKRGADAAPVGKFVSWVQEKPLRVMGFGSMVSDILLGLSAYREYKSDPKQKSYIFKFITTGMYVLADVLMAISHKDHTNGEGKFDAEEQRRIIALAAETIARQPKAMRDPLADQVSGLLATNPEMKGTATDISKAIKEQMIHMPSNPWSCRTGDFLLPPSLQV